jgi:hypothetical protein
MSWKDRLQPTIKLTSPGGASFTAQWKQNPRSVERRLAVYHYPLVKGAVVEDFEADEFRHTINFFFEGDNNDVLADGFMAAAGGDKGAWTVVHPVKGTLSLYLVRASEEIDPTVSGNVTEIHSEWVEPEFSGSGGGGGQSVAGLKSSVQSQVSAVNSASAEQYSRSTFSMSNVRQAVSTIANTIRVISPRALAAQQGVLTGILAKPPDLKAIATGLQSMVVSTSSDVTELRSLIGSAISGAVEQEVVVVVAFTTMIARVVTLELEDREQALWYINYVSDSFNELVAELDTKQIDTSLGRQYFTLSEIYNQLTDLVASLINYLLRASFDLAIAYYFSLERPRSPVEISASVYGSFERLDFFITTNKLSGRDILLLPAGRRVVCYIQ